MPISTDNSDWRQESEEESFKEEIRSYLREHSDKAFHIREIADELLDTDWETFHKREEKIQKLGKDEFYNRLQNGDFPELERETVKTAKDGDRTDVLFTLVDTLVDEGNVAMKYVSGEHNPVPGQDASPEYFSWKEDNQD